MPRYIDAGRLLKELSFYADRPTKRAMDCVKGYALISDPDVLKVVRCKDCRWGYHYGTTDEGKPYYYCTITNWAGQPPEFFCANGEREEKTDEKTIPQS